MEKRTFFVCGKKTLIEEDGILPIPLFKGMIISIHGYEKDFVVENWTYHHGHPDENAGLTIYLTQIV
jgi:hypothetical protein